MTICTLSSHFGLTAWFVNKIADLSHALFLIVLHYLIKLKKLWCLGYTVCWAKQSNIVISSKPKLVGNLTLHKVCIQIRKIRVEGHALHLYTFTIYCMALKEIQVPFLYCWFTQLKDRKKDMKLVLQFWWDHQVVEDCLITILISMMVQDLVTTRVNEFVWQKQLKGYLKLGQENICPFKSLFTASKT